MIGIFDSGLGGLTIFTEIRKTLPQYDYVYLGDNARSPYGDHSQETIFQYTTEALTWLFEQGCVLIILACHTASAEALRKIQREWLPARYPDRNVLGVVRPLAEAASQHARAVVGVIGTRSTIMSHAHKREVRQLNPKLTVVEQACRLLVPLIEEGYDRKPEMRMILKKYLRPLKERHVDLLVLGCTHYGIIATDICRLMGKNVRVLDSGTIVARKLADYLSRHPEYEGRLSKKGLVKFYTTESTETVRPLAQRFWGEAVTIEKIRLTE